jgi:hypothetical protein
VSNRIGIGRFKLWRGENGEILQTFENPHIRKRWTWPWQAPYCVQLCGHNLHRLHFTCLFCRPRRVYEKKLPETIPVSILTLFIHQSRRHARFKNRLLKVWAEIAELLAN